jgi:hypothetical protein
MRSALLLVPLLLSACGGGADVGAPLQVDLAGLSPAEAGTRLAEEVLERVGGREAWKAARHLHWVHFGRREYWWDKQAGDVRLSSEGVVALWNVETRVGRVYQGGVEVTDEERRQRLLEQAHGWWKSDIHWMFLPFLLLDPGVKLASLGAEETHSGRAAQALEVTFEDPDLEERYVVRVAEKSGLIEETSTYASAEATVPRVTSPWQGWQRFGGLLLSTERGNPDPWQVEVQDEVPEGTYTRP